MFRRVTGMTRGTYRSPAWCIRNIIFGCADTKHLPIPFEVAYVILIRAYPGAELVVQWVAFQVGIKR